MNTDQIKRVQQLEKENQLLRKKSVTVEQNSRNHNLVIHGLNKHPFKIKKNFICNQIETLLGFDLHRSDIKLLYAWKKRNRFSQRRIHFTPQTKEYFEKL